MGLVGALSVILPFFLYTADTRFPGLAAIPPVAGAALLIWAGMGRPDLNNGNWQPTLTQRLLAIRPLVWIGLLSYSLYLWHWPLLAFHRYLGIFQTSVSIRASLLVASLILAWLSLRYVEQPFRRRGLVPTRRAAFTISAATILVLIIPCFVLWKENGLPQRLSSKAKLFVTASMDSAYIKDLTLSSIPKNLVKFGAAEKAPVVFVWGDSHAMAILPAIDGACKKLNFAGAAATHSATAPVLNWFKLKGDGLGSEAPPYNREILNYLSSSEARATIKTVILAARWSIYSNDDLAPFQTALISTVEAIKGYGYRVIILKQAPTWSTPVPKALILEEMTGANQFHPQADPSMKDYYHRRQGLLFSLLPTSDSAVQVVDPWESLKNEYGNFVPADENGALFCDHHHLSVHGALRLVPAFEQLLASSTAGNVLPLSLKPVSSAFEVGESYSPAAH